MIVFVACAKIMTDRSTKILPFTTEPRFQLQANENAIQLATYSVEDHRNMLKVNSHIAQETWERYQHFFHNEENRKAAMFSYNGMVFKKLAPESFSEDELSYANSHLLIGSFLYGLLRPLDLIAKYRLEGNVVLPKNKEKNMFDYWKPLLTDYFIEQIKADDGVLVNLASSEMKSLFDWKKVEREVQIVTPEFQITKDDKLKTIVVYTKMCRGAMARFILKNRMVSPEELKMFEYEGFLLDEQFGEYHYQLK